MCGIQRSLCSILPLAIATAIVCASRLDCQVASPQALYDQAGKALDDGNTNQAIILYEELIQQVPDSVEARTNLGAALAQQGRYDDARKQYRQALARDPHNETVLLDLALAFYKQADFSQARSQLETLHKLHPANRQALYLLADCDLRLGKFQDTIALVEPAYDAHPDDPALDYILSKALIQDGQTQKGAAVIDRILRNGNPAVAGLLMGAAQEAAGDHKTAVATIHKALELNPDIPGGWTIYGKALLQNGQREESATALRRALQADPNDFDACLHLGAILRHDGDVGGAEPYLKRALLLRPESAAAQFQVSSMDAGAGHLDEARSGFEKLVKQWPDFVEAHVQLAMVYARLHRTEDSKREQQIALELNDRTRAKGPQPELTP